MRLLYRDATGAIRLTEDLHKNIPPYAILSHRWGLEEVTLQELIDGTGPSKRGYKKIRFCGEQAQCDSLSHFWVDTCCIDKKNSVELQEAINSMFRWYRNAARCYVYLDDVSCPATTSTEPPGAPAQKKRKRMDIAASPTVQPTEPLWQAAFRDSLWFTRGWTLQELLAPSSVEFFSSEGTLLGNKSSLELSIHNLTHIPVEALRHGQLSNFCVSDRYAWMNHRETTREEDKAYALLGIFDIQMPLIYGEGYATAFRRLQREVSQATKPPLMPVAEGAAFDSRAEEHNARCHPETRVDLLSQIASWAADPDGKVIFWLNGIAGTGKSTISRTIAQHFHERSLLGASFFFKRGEAYRGHAGRLFTTIAAQLAVKLPYVAQQIQAAIDADPDLYSKALREQFEKLIIHALTNIHNPQTLIIVIDALDECDHDTDIRAIIHLLSQARTLPHVRLKTFLTSRPELPIRLGFKKILGSYQNIVLHEIPQPIIIHDLRVFFEFELARIRNEYNASTFEELELPPDWPGQQIETLVHMSVPLFIFATTICRFLEDPAWYNPASQLQKLLDYQATSCAELDKLSCTYLPVLAQLVAGKSEAQKERLLEDFRNIVGAIVLLAEPLSATALSKLLNIPLSIIQRQLQTLHSVLSIPARADAPIRTFHLSFHDFLIDPAKKSTNNFWIDEQAAHKRLAARCIQLLSVNKVLKKDICNLQQPGISFAQVDRQTIDKYLPPEVQYACLYWVYHLELCNISVQDKDQVHTFLQTHFLHWLEALCLIGNMHKSISMIEALRKRCQPGMYISNFLQDAHRFILNCIHVVITHPLQLYSSAICFSPEKSMIRKEVQREMSAWIVKAPAMEKPWSACLQTLEGHSGQVSSITISPNGRWLASGLSDHTIKVWNAVTGVCTQTLKGHSGQVETDIMSPNSCRLASASNDFRIKIWDLETGACIQTLEDDDCHCIKSIVMLCDGQRLISYGSPFLRRSDIVIKIWDVVAGTCVQKLEAYSGLDFYHTAISPNGGWLALGSGNIIKIWDVSTGTYIQELKSHTQISRIAISPDGRLLVSQCCHTDRIEIWDMATSTCLQTLEGPDDLVASIVISPNNRWLATGGSYTPDLSGASIRNPVQVWDIATGDLIQTLEGHTDSVHSIAMSPDSCWLASGSSDYKVKVWDVAIGAYTQESEPDIEGRAFSIAVSPDGRWFASGHWYGVVEIRDVVTGTCTQKLRDRTCKSTWSVNSIAISPNSRWLASASRNCTIMIWDIAAGACIQLLKDDSGPIVWVTISPNGRWLASLCRTPWPEANSIVNIWDVGTGACRQTLSVDPAISILALVSNTCIRTNTGTINLDLDSYLDTPISKMSEALLATEDIEVHNQEYGIHASKKWITWKDQRVMWLPPKYRPIFSAIGGTTIAIVYGHSSESVLVFKFSTNNPTV